MILSLVLGTVVLIPDVGAFLIRGSGLTVSSYETAGDFPVRMLITSLMTVALVYVACCYLGASSRLAKLLMAAVFVSFLMTLPWSAPLWRVHALTNFQFPWRFGSILTIAAVALYAMAMDKLIRERSSQNWRSVWILSCAAFMVVVVGMFAWRVQMRFTHPSTVDQALVRNVDNMYRSYVPGDQVAGFARLIKSNEETFDVVSTPIDEYVRGEAVRSEIASGRCSAKVTPTRPESMAVSAECQEDTVLRIGQLYSPLWQVIPTSDRSLRQVLQSSNDGLIEVALPRGMHDFEITFDLGATLRTGIIVTLLSAAMAAIAALAGHFGLFEGRRK